MHAVGAMRLGVVWEHGSNAQYRAFQPMRAMSRQGHEVIWPPSTQGEADLSRLQSCDVVHCYRRIDRPTRRVFAELLRRGIPVTYDNDDDFVNLPRESPQYDQVGGVAGRRVFATMVAMARSASCFTTTTDALAARYREAGVERIEVIANALTPDKLRPRTPHQGLVIGWVGGVEHQADIVRIPIASTLERILETHQHVRVEAIGVDLRLTERYRHDEIVAFEELPERIGAWDVAIAPLADIPFNRARSDIKLKEYAASGVPWLASPVGPYVGLGESQGGRLVPDDGWFAAVDRLVTRSREREQLGDAGRAWAERNTIEQVVPRWEQVFANAAGLHRGARSRRVVRLRMPPRGAPRQGGTAS